MLPLLLLAPALAAASLLSDQLSAVQFLHEGVVTPADTFDFNPIASQYLEAENISSYVSSWGKGGGFPYLYLHNASSPPYACAALGPLQPGTDLPGGDLDARQLPGGSTVQDCQALCCATQSCVAFTYAQSAPSNFLGCSQGAPCCYLKATAGAPRAAASLESGSVTPGGAALAATPPHGLRSAVPLGGLGAGTIELRGDGTFHECTMHNAHPAAAAKQGVLAEALLGVRVDAAGAQPVARALRTSPPPYAAGAGVASLAYAGAYPVSRLRVQDPALAPALASLQLFAYAPFKPASEPEMAHPAVAFSLLATSAAATPVNVTLYLALPWGAINDCDRVGNGSTTLSAAPQPSAAACLAACAAAPLCAAWTWAPAGTLCTLSGEPGLSRFRSGSACGVGGGWVSAGGAALTFKGDAQGNAPLAPAVGDVTLMAGSDALAGAAALVGRSPDALWAAFANPGAAPGPDAFPPTASAAPAGFASLAVTMTLAPGATEAVSLLWAWHFPNKDWYQQTVGNFYANLWPDSAAVAAELAAAGRLASVVGDINAHHVVMMGPPASSALPPSPIPDWLRDSLTNQFSHFRSMHWTADGRMRCVG
jgi:non-lysosomal glucosylceramidase